MKGILVLWAAALVGIGLDGNAAAQNIEILPPDAPPPRRSPAPPPDAPEVAPATPGEAPPAAPPEGTPAAPPEGPAGTPTEAPPATPAAAAAFGEAWHYAISIERAVGIDHVSQTESFSGTDTKMSATNLSLFGVPTSGALSAFSFPRGAFDLFVASDFSVGLGVGLIHGSTSIVQTNGGPNTSQSSTGILAAPRAGYAWHLTPDITLWTRAGLSVVYVKTSAGNGYGSQDQSERLFAATIELPAVFAVAPRVAFTAGPTLDISFSGKRTGPGLGDAYNPPPAEHVTELGLQAGLLIHL